jgi:hypothetical protein
MTSVKARQVPISTGATQVQMPLAVTRRNLVSFLVSEASGYDDAVQFVSAKETSDNVFESVER